MYKIKFNINHVFILLFITKNPKYSHRQIKKLKAFRSVAFPHNYNIRYLGMQQ